MIAHTSPHMEQPSLSSVHPLHLYLRAFSSSMQVSNMVSQSRAFLALAMRESLSLPMPLLRSPTWAAIFDAITPSLTSSTSGRDRCSAGVR